MCSAKIHNKYRFSGFNRLEKTTNKYRQKADKK